MFDRCPQKVLDLPQLPACVRLARPRAQERWPGAVRATGTASYGRRSAQVPPRCARDGAVGRGAPARQRVVLRVVSAVSPDGPTLWDHSGLRWSLTPSSMSPCSLRLEAPLPGGALATALLHRLATAQTMLVDIADSRGHVDLRHPEALYCADCVSSRCPHVAAVAAAYAQAHPMSLRALLLRETIEPVPYRYLEIRLPFSRVGGLVYVPAVPDWDDEMGPAEIYVAMYSAERYRVAWPRDGVWVHREPESLAVVCLRDSSRFCLHAQIVLLALRQQNDELERTAASFIAYDWNIDRAVTSAGRIVSDVRARLTGRR